jgi:NAD(P)-dependent dehydrogenase (short-subunit alcohol dehydrogenase family)
MATNRPVALVTGTSSGIGKETPVPSSLWCNASNRLVAIREVGGAVGVASPAAVFSAQGGYGSASLFVDGLVPELWAEAGAAALLRGAAPSSWREERTDGRKKPCLNPA